MKITDQSGAEIGYLPVSLISGEESPIITLTVTPGSPGELLRSGYSDYAKIMGRVQGGGPFVDLFDNPLDLSPYYGGSVFVEVKITAAVGVLGLVRVGQSVAVIFGSPADWHH